MNKKTIEKIIDKLNKVYDISWHYERGDPFKVLIGTVLSQRTKDEVTWPSNEKLFKVANNPEKMMKLSEEKIARLIYPVGFYNQKAKRIREISKILTEEYDGKVPNSREELMKLPGVGGKTADCVLVYSHGEDVIPVDIHVEVISKRLGLVNKKDNPEMVREKLHRLIPKEKRRMINALFVEHGKAICQTAKPKCDVCPVERYCPKLI